MMRARRSGWTALAAALALTCSCGGARNAAAPDQAGDAAVGSAEGSGAVLFTDDFSNSESGWEVDRDSSFTTAYADGGYEIVNSDTNLITKGMLETPEAADGDVAVTVRQTAGDPAIRFGLVLRRSRSGFLQAGITGDGKALFGEARYRDYVLVQHPEAVPFAAVRPAGATNRLRVEMNGARAVFWVNGERFGELDDVGSDGREIGLFSTSDTAPSRVVFDDFILRAPPA